MVGRRWHRVCGGAKVGCERSGVGRGKEENDDTREYLDSQQI
jgi:hypothetical protein